MYTESPYSSALNPLMASPQFRKRPEVPTMANKAPGCLSGLLPRRSPSSWPPSSLLCGCSHMSSVFPPQALTVAVPSAPISLLQRPPEAAPSLSPYSALFFFASLIFAWHHVTYLFICHPYRCRTATWCFCPYCVPRAENRVWHVLCSTYAFTEWRNVDQLGKIISWQY